MKMLVKKCKGYINFNVLRYKQNHRPIEKGKNRTGRTQKVISSITLPRARLSKGV